MKKKIKMMLYGVPGVGKSVFALQFPKPFFITTDGNYEWLDEFGAQTEDHKQVGNWAEFLKLKNEINLEKYDTIVVDLIEDLYKYCEKDFIKKNKIDHIGDMAFGKGYSMVRDSFFEEVKHLIGLDKNIIFLSHETSQTLKDKRGVESTIYYPSKTVPENLRDQIEGRLRYVLRARFEDEIDGNKVIQKRILSLAKDSNEFSIIRGVDMSKLKEKIELNFDEFVKELKLDEKTTINVKKPNVTEKVEVNVPLFDVNEITDEKIESAITNNPQPPVEVVEAISKIKENVENKNDEALEEKEDKLAKVKALLSKKKENSTETKEEKTESNSREEMLSAIRAKLAKMKEGK